MALVKPASVRNHPRERRQERPSCATRCEHRSPDERGHGPTRRRERQSDTGIRVGTVTLRTRELTRIRRGNASGLWAATSFDTHGTNLATRDELLELRVQAQSLPRIPGRSLRSSKTASAGCSRAAAAVVSQHLQLVDASDREGQPGVPPRHPSATPTVGDTSTLGARAWTGVLAPRRRGRRVPVRDDCRPLPTGRPSGRARNSRSPWQTRSTAETALSTRTSTRAGAPRRPATAPQARSRRPPAESATIENWSAAALGVPALSCAAPAAMSTVTAPEASGVIVAV